MLLISLILFLLVYRRRLLLFAILNGFLFFISWPPINFFTFFIFIVFVPLLMLAEDVKKKNTSYKEYFLYSYITFFIFNLFTTFWIKNAHIGGAVFAILCNSFFMAFILYLYAKISNSIKWKNTIFILPVLWIGFEYLHLNWDLSWPWLTLGNIFSSHPNWVQWYSYTGVLGGSLWILAINLVIFKLYQNKSSFKKAKPYIITLLIFLTGPLLLSQIVYNQNKNSDHLQKKTIKNNDFENSINVLIVQPNIDPYTDKFSLSQTTQMEDVLTLINNHVDSNLNYLILPETFLIDPIWESRLLDDFNIQTLNRLSNQYKFDIIVGATTLMLSEKSSTSKPLSSADNLWYEVYNSALHLKGQKKHINSYHKSKLVPGAEQMPFQSVLYPIFGDGILNIGQSTAIGNFSKQDTVTIFNESIAPIICYESIYGDHVAKFVRKGAQAIVIITNDGWWKKTSGYKQHNMYAKLRAIETRRYIARSANTGISSVINSFGEIENSLNWDVQGVIKSNIKLNNEQTFYVKYGDVLGRLSAFLSIILVLYFFVTKLINKLQVSRK